MVKLFDPHDLPEPEVLRRRHMALLLVDEGLGGPASFRWLDSAPNGPLAYWESGSGDHYFARFWPDGALLWGLDHESEMSPWAHPDEPDEWPGMTDGLPADYKQVLDAEPNPNYRRSMSFCFWHDGEQWHATNPEPPDSGPPTDDPQGVRDVLGKVLTRDAAAAHVETYHERPALKQAAEALLRAAEGGTPLRESDVEPFAEQLPVPELLARARSVALAVS